MNLGRYLIKHKADLSAEDLVRYEAETKALRKVTGRDDYLAGPPQYKYGFGHAGIFFIGIYRRKEDGSIYWVENISIGHPGMWKPSGEKGRMETFRQSVSKWWNSF